MNKASLPWTMTRGHGLLQLSCRCDEELLKSIRKKKPIYKLWVSLFLLGAGGGRGEGGGGEEEGGFSPPVYIGKRRHKSNWAR